MTESVTYVIETSKKTYIHIEQVGNTELDAYDHLLPYHGEQFDKEEEAEQFIKDLESGKTLNGNTEFSIYINEELFPLKSRKLTMNWSLE